MVLRYAAVCVVALCVAFLAAPCAGQGAKQFLKNGDFEQPAPRGVPGWSLSFYPKGEGVERCVGISDARARSGKRALRVDTGPVLGRELAIVFNGAVDKAAAALRGERLALSGWLYLEKDSAVRTLRMRLRTFGRDAQGKTTFLGDVLALTLLGSPGQWTKFEATGVVPDADVTSMDLHCSIRPDVVRVVLYLDDLRLTRYVPPALELEVFDSAQWRDAPVLAARVAINEEVAGAKVLRLRLVDRGGKVVREWRRPAKGGVFGLELGEELLPEGEYTLRAEVLRAGGAVALSAEQKVLLCASPWEGAPAGTAAAARAAAQASRAAAPEGFTCAGTVAPTDIADALPAKAEELSPDVSLAPWRARGYVVFSRHWLEPVSRRGRPRPGEIGPLRLFAAPGEYEPATVSVWALKGLRALRVRATALVGEKAAIAQANVDVRVVRQLPGLPAFLEKRLAVDLPQGQTQRFWLTIYVPPGTRAGFYRGTVTVSAENAPAAELPLLLRVLPLNLPAPKKGYGFWWKLDSRWNGYYSKEHDEAIAQMRKQFVLLREHGCNMVSCYGMPKMTVGADGTVHYDFAQDHWGHNKYSLEEFFRVGRETGFLSPRVPIQYVGADSLHSSWVARALGLNRDSREFDRFYVSACRTIDQWAKKQGYTLAFACVDEIGNSEQRRKDALRFYALAKEAGALTSVTDNSMHGGVHLMGQARFDEKIALRVYNFITPEMIADARRAGDRLWLYNMASGGRQAKRDRFVFGLFVERCGAEGYAQWAFQWPSGKKTPYEAAAAGERTGYHYALPAPDGPLPTVALEGVREGIDDARYIALLRERAPHEAEQLLQDIPPLSLAISPYLEEHKGRFFDLRRWQIARRLLAK